MENELNKVSYSQYRIWSTCPKQWKLMYVDGHREDSSSIDTVFGTAIHETIQGWLPTYFGDPKKSKLIDIGDTFKEIFMKLFMEKIEIVDGKKIFLCDVHTFQEYYEDGCSILSHVQKYAKDFFPTKNCELVGCEVEIEHSIRENVTFIAYLDIVVRDVKDDIYYIYDLKTSRAGWYSSKKKDPKVVNQILLYKKFYSEKYSIPLDRIIPKFIILKRKISNNPDFIIRRLSNFEPSHGKISMKRATESWETFLNECFTESGQYKEETTATPSESACKYCLFRDDEDKCSEGYYTQKKKRQELNKKLAK